jgi:two-component system, LytTR family, response regulator
MKSIIVEDEKKARQLLRVLLEENCPNVEVLEDCSDLAEGVRAIKKHKPDVVFLDIELPGMSGLRLLDFFNEEEITFSIIFVTAYNDYAIQAFKLSAVDYLLKPLNVEQLKEAVIRLEKITAKRIAQLNALKLNLSVAEEKKIVIPSRDNISYLDPKEVLYIKAEGAYSVFYLQNGTRHMLSRNLKHVEDMLNGMDNFKRCHKSYIINAKFIQQYSRADGELLLPNNIRIPVASDRMGDIAF